MRVKKRSIAVLILIICMGYSVYRVVSFFDKHSTYEVSTCILKGFGNSAIIYMYECQGCLPDSLKEIHTYFDYDYDESFYCPLCKREYVYTGQGVNDEMGGEIILAYCDCESDDWGYQILLSDGRSEYYIKPDKMLEYLEKDRELRTIYKLKQIDMNQIRYTDTVSLADYEK